MSKDSDIPIGLCQCGCGGVTPIIGQTRSSRGYRKGDRVRFLPRHNRYHRTTKWIVDKETGCWVWQRSKNKDGYAIDRRPYGAHVGGHVLQYEKKYGLVPEGKELDHICKNPACVNPDHLEPVPHIVNSQRGRHAKLTVEQVLLIRKLSAQGFKSGALGRRFMVTRHTINNVVSRRQWRNIEPEQTP